MTELDRRRHELSARQTPGVRAWLDRHRPRYHFVAPSGWLNDPNGLVQWQGRYHLFYQHNPHTARHVDVHWGHATSDDLVNWRDEPVALVPGDGPDRDGCWSGVLVDDDGVPTIVYSGNDNAVGQRTCLAIGDADLRSWRKHPGNPVIPHLPAADLVEYRDHCVWREGGEWRQLVGSGFHGRGGAALLYRSPDLRNWEYLGPLIVGDAASRDPVWTGTVWECVDLFRLGQPDHEHPDVLMLSAWADGATLHPVALTGRYESNTFEPRAAQPLDFGGRHFYAPQSLVDDEGRRIVMGWMQEGRSVDACVDAAWAGVLSVPRQARLGQDGLVLLEPVDEIASLRREHESFGPIVLADGDTVPMRAGDQLDFAMDLVVPEATALHFDVLSAPEGGERTRISIDGGGDAHTVRLTLDRSQSSLDPDVDTSPHRGVVPVDQDRRVELRVLIDHSALEVFANGRALSTRVYPIRSDATGTRLTAAGGAIQVESLDVWRMADVWTGPREVQF